MAITIEQLYSQTIYVGVSPVSRFPPSAEYTCPNCGGPVLEDNWPPNYWSYSGDFSGAHMISGEQKCVCLTCAIQFTMHHYENSLTGMKRSLGGGAWEAVPLQVKQVWLGEIAPLVERDGKYLTEIDVYTDDYKREHGEPPNLAYG